MTPDEQAIRHLVATWSDATKRGDTQTVLGLMAEDVVFLVAGQPPMIGRAAFATASNAQSGASGARPVFEVTQEIQEITISGDCAYMWTRLKVMISPADGSPPITRAGHTLSVLRKQHGQWLIVRDANMLALVKS